MRPALGFSLLALVGFSAGPAETAAASVALVQLASRPTADLAEVPVPDLEGLEPVVAQQLQDERARAEQAFVKATNDEERAAAYGEIGQVYYAYDFFELASACFEHASAWDREEFRWTYFRATLLHKAGDLQGASEAYRQALRLRPGDLSSLIHFGRVQLEQGQLEAARERLTKALELSPLSPAALAVLGEVDLASGEYRQAARHFENALQQVPEANRLHYSLAMAYRGLGETEKARTHLAARGIVGVAVPDPLVDGLREFRAGERVYLLRGRTAFAAADFVAAEREFRQAVQAAPASARSRVNLGTALGQLGRPSEAIASYEAALEISPSATAHFNLGILLSARGDLDAALEHLERAAMLAPDDEAVRLELASLLRQSGRFPEALTHYAAVRDQEPTNEDASLGEAAVWVDQGRFPEALERLEEAHALRPDSGRIAAALAKFLAACPDAGLRNGARALDLARRVFDARQTLEHAELVALALAEFGQCEEAAQWQGQALIAAREANHPRIQELERTLQLYAACVSR